MKKHPLNNHWITIFIMTIQLPIVILRLLRLLRLKHQQLCSIDNALSNAPKSNE
jgi:hypothetical protein